MKATRGLGHSLGERHSQSRAHSSTRSQRWSDLVCWSSNVHSKPPGWECLAVEPCPWLVLLLSSRPVLCRSPEGNGLLLIPLPVQPYSLLRSQLRGPVLRETLTHRLHGSNPSVFSRDCVLTLSKARLSLCTCFSVSKSRLEALWGWNLYHPHRGSTGIWLT